MTNYRTPTVETYEGLDKAFEHFNRELFGDRLQPFLITPYKLFVARPAAAPRYRAMLPGDPRIGKAALSERTMFDAPITVMTLGRREVLKRSLRRKLGLLPKRL